MSRDRYAWVGEAFARRPALRADSANRLVLLGTAGGSNPKATRCGFANAVAVGDSVYLVDCGEGVHRQMWRAGFTANPRFGHGTRPLVKAICITHTHADHIVDLANLLQGSWPNTPIDVYGPGPAGPPFTTWNDPVHPLRFPEAPAPGLRAIVDHCNRAFATNINARVIAEGRADYVDFIHVHEIGLASEKVGDHGEDIGIDLGPGCVIDRSLPDFEVPAMEPFAVQPEDSNGVTITAILVQHPPVFPALAYRFDTPTGSVAFSGDTGPCDNVVRLAAGADLLVHEVIDLGALLARFTNQPNFEQIRAQLSRSHTPIDAVGGIAQRAGVGTLVLSHLVPGEDARTPEEWEALARPGFDGKVVCGVDLDELPIGESP